MQANGDRPGTGDFTFGQDYWREQFEFLRSIEREVPDALGALKGSVLPVWSAANLRRRRRGMEGYSGYDRETWNAIWDWAHNWGLVQTDELPLLKRPEAVLIAVRMQRDYMDRASPAGVEPFKPESAAVVFNLGAVAPVVLRTLIAWSENANEGHWVFPEPAPAPITQDPEAYAQSLNKLLQAEQTRTMIEAGQLRTPDPPPGDYTFTVRAWRPRLETRGKASERIMKDLAEQLQKQMDQHEEIAQKMGLEKHPQITRWEQFDWLAQYQVKGWSKAQVARQVKETWPAKGTTVVHLTETVRQGINSAAQLVVGPSWNLWLRRGKPGRPQKS